MSDKNLRRGLIHLAHTNPDLRKDILPLLKTGATSNPFQLYENEGWEKVSKDIEADIQYSAELIKEEIKKAKKSLENLTVKYEKFGATDPEAYHAIFREFSKASGLPRFDR